MFVSLPKPAGVPGNWYMVAADGHTTSWRTNAFEIDTLYWAKGTHKLRFQFSEDSASFTSAR